MNVQTKEGSSRMKLEFTKMQGAGNDYVYFNCLDREFPEGIDPSALSRRLSDRHFGIGGDGIALIMPSATCDFRMRLFNADGSEAPMCGNASRCIGRFVYDRGYTDKTEFTLETMSGVKHIFINRSENGDVSVGVDIGRASFEPADVPAVLPCSADEFEVDGDKAVVVSVGTAHCVIFSEEIDGYPLESVATGLVSRGLFPDGVNTEIVRVEKDGLYARVFERGSGETLACGTGASASVAAAVRLGFFPHGKKIPVKMPGGTITVTVTKDFTVLMEGPTAVVFEGTVDV